MALLPLIYYLIRISMVLPSLKITAIYLISLAYLKRFKNFWGRNLTQNEYSLRASCSISTRSGFCDMR